MKIGVSAFAWTDSFGVGQLDLLPKVREFGFAGLEIPMFSPADLPVTALRKAFEANDLECTICAILPDGVNPISPDAGTRKRAVDHLVACVEAAAEVGAHLLGGPLFAPIGYLPGHRPTDDEWAWATEGFQSLRELLETHAMTLSIEPVNRSETFFIRTAADANRLCTATASPYVGVTIDTFHANIEEKSIPKAIESLGPRLRHMHISENDRGLLGSGHIDFSEILRSLKKTGYTGYLIVEGFGFPAGNTHGPGTLWADPDVSPEAVALQGLRYLQTLVE